jgi:hypothetical protein
MAGPLKNGRREKFCQLIAGGMAINAAFEAAGFAANDQNASRLRSTSACSARIDELMTLGADQVLTATMDAISASGLSREWVIDRLIKNAERAAQAIPVTIAGIPTGEYRYDGPTVNRALELLGKITGLWIEKPGEGADDIPENVSKTLQGPGVVTTLDRYRSRLGPPKKANGHG